MTLVALVLLLGSCGKAVYNGSDNAESGRQKTHAISSGGNVNAGDGWNTLDIKLDRGDDKALYAELKQWLGTPYKYAACNKGEGTDCSGLVMQVFLSVYKIPLERKASRIYERNCRDVSRDDLREGDLVFFNNGSSGNITHVGIYLKDGYFVHASSSHGVIVSNMSQRYYSTHFQCAGRVKK